MTCLLPAEWHPQDAVMLTWPHADSDWASVLPHIEATMLTLATEIGLRQHLLIVCQNWATQTRLNQALTAAGVPTAHQHFSLQPSDDTWARDHGPITVLQDQTPHMLDFGFNGWGGKFPAEQDNALNAGLMRQQLLACPMSAHKLILEGGSIETDGQGTLLTTSACLLNPNRNPTWSQAQIEAYLSQHLGIERFLWLHHGHLAGDDTDSHIDTLARFCEENTIAYVTCEDPNDPHYGSLKQMQAELEAFKTAHGEPYRLIPLPMAPALLHPEEQYRLPATYANFLIINGAVIMPTHDDPERDAAAASALQTAFPTREIIGIDARIVVQQHGSLHCLTMQLPTGTLRL